MLGIFSMEPVRFPEGFLWGSATAGHQIEGDNVNSSCWHKELREHCPEPSGKACNFLKLWQRDLAMLSDLKHQVFRMSIEWSRIEPAEGLRNENALKYYLSVFEELKKRNIKLCLTLHHFSHPQWFEEKGEFSRRENLGYFLKHVEYLAPIVAPYVDFWNIFNEFNNFDDPKLYDRKANMLVAHAKAFAIIRNVSAAPVSSAHAMTPYQPQHPDDAFDITMARIKNWAVNDFFYHAIRTGEILFPYRKGEMIEGLKDSCDFWSINYYTRHFVSARDEKGEAQRYKSCQIRPIEQPFYLEEFYPQGFTDGLCALKDRPIYITENGFCCKDDRLRILYLGRNLQALSEAMERGCDIRGYFYWSLMDNYEWWSFVPRFGMVGVDFQTFERTLKPSAQFFREIIENNGFDRELMLKYLPEFKDWQIFPVQD